MARHPARPTDPCLFVDLMGVTNASKATLV
jgi:hypothetical protein